MADGLSYSVASGIFPDKRIMPEFPALVGGFFATEPPGKPPYIFFEKIFFPRAPAVVREWSGGLPGSSHTWPSPVWEKCGSQDGTCFWSMGRVQVELQKKVLPSDNDTFVFLDHLWFHFLFILYFFFYLFKFFFYFLN